MWNSIGMHCWVFDGEPISWTTPFFPIINPDTEIYLKGFANFKLTWFSLCSKKILIDTCGGGMRYFNRLVLCTILVIFISLTLMKILWIINTEEHMAT